MEKTLIGVIPENSATVMANSHKCGASLGVLSHKPSLGDCHSRLDRCRLEIHGEAGGAKLKLTLIQFAKAKLVLKYLVLKLQNQHVLILNGLKYRERHKEESQSQSHYP